MSAEVLVRLAVVEDVGEIGALFVVLDEHHLRLRPELFKRLDGPARDAASIAALVASEQQLILVAEAKDGPGALLGFVHVFERAFPETTVAPGRRVAEVDAIAVRADCRGRGIARALLSQVEPWARARGLSALELNVRAFNDTAVAAYEGLGFEVLAHRMGRTL